MFLHLWFPSECVKFVNYVSDAPAAPAAAAAAVAVETRDANVATDQEADRGTDDTPI